MYSSAESNTCYVLCYLEGAVNIQGKNASRKKKIKKNAVDVGIKPSSNSVASIRVAKMT